MVRVCFWVSLEVDHPEDVLLELDIPEGVLLVLDTVGVFLLELDTGGWVPVAGDAISSDPVAPKAAYLPTLGCWCSSISWPVVTTLEQVRVVVISFV